MADTDTKGSDLGSPFAAEMEGRALTVYVYRRAPASTGWYRKGAWTRQFRLYAPGCWTWFDWWRKADIARLGVRA